MQEEEEEEIFPCKKEIVHNLKQEEEKGYDSPEKKTSNN
jgi:hypothetical protein